MLCLNKFFFNYLGLIEFINDPNEAANDIFKNICTIIDDYKLKFENLTSYGADNANVNYGEHHSVFKLLKDKVPHLVRGKYKRLLYDFLIHLLYSSCTFALLYFR